MENLWHAWAAGIIDGEGCICIRKRKPNIKKGEKNYTYNLCIVVSMTHLPTIEKLNSIFPGYIEYIEKGKDNWKTQARWWAKNSDNEYILLCLIDYLVCKKDDAKTALEFIKLPKGTDFKESPEWLLIKKEELYQQAKANKKYEFTEQILKYRIKKPLKKDIIIDCLICNVKMNKFHSNGIERYTCSIKCREIKKNANIPTKQII